MKLIYRLAALFLLLATSRCTPLPNDSSLVVASTEQSSTNKEETSNTSEASIVPPSIYQMDINSNISNRFATTLLTSKVRNLNSVAQEATFSVVLPEKAFISGFVMEIDGNSYTAYVKEKEEAIQIYNQAIESGAGAAHVAVSARDSNRFTVSVNVEPESKATFYLTYEELLERSFGQYELVLNVHPGQIVDDLNIEVRINETQPLKFVRTPSLRSGNEISKEDDKNDLPTDIEIINKTSAVVKFKPGPEEQRKYEKELNSKEGTGISGQFVVQYDIDRTVEGGEILLNDGYFVHFFSSEEQDPLPRQIIFVLDTSGSMEGTKISQLREAMTNILDQIKGDNLLSVVQFNWGAQVWDIEKIAKDAAYDPSESDILPLPVPTNDDVIKNAKEMTSRLTADGSTSMLRGLRVAIEIIKRVQKKEGDKYQPLIVVLTDGQPTDADADQIVDEITKLNDKQSAIFSLSIGDYADKNFLRKLSTKNYGYSKHIYEAADASLQLEKFYKQIASPLLSNLQFKYTTDAENLTQTVFPLYFDGGEIIICGVYGGASENFSPTIESKSAKGLVLKHPPVVRTILPLERHWVYLTIKQTLDQRKTAENKEELTKKALDLALRYSLVTDVTSLVVVKPNSTSAVDTEDAAKNGDDLDSDSFSGSYGNRALYYSEPISLQGSYGYPALYNSAPVPLKGTYITQPLYKSAPVPLQGFPGSSNYLTRDEGTAQMLHKSTKIAKKRIIKKKKRPRANDELVIVEPSIPPPPCQPVLPQGPPAAPASAPPTSTPILQPSQSVTDDLVVVEPCIPPLPAYPPVLLHIGDLPGKPFDGLTWLRPILKPNTTSIVLPQGTFELILNQPLGLREIPCNSSLIVPGIEGLCVPLDGCSEGYPLLKTLSDYLSHFCAIDNKIAGVCCRAKIHSPQK